MGVKGNSSTGWLAASGLAVIVLGIAFYHVPTASAALFAYAGHALNDGKTLYRDVWDDKLPSIYYLNAFWHAAFGARYALHWAAELCVLGATVALFAILAYRERVEHWAPATFGFALLLGLPPLRHLNYTEPYALFLVMLALVAAQRRAPLSSAIALASAATFWLPALFQAAAIVVLRRDGQRRFVATLLAACALLAIAIVAAFGARSIVAGVWATYGWQDVRFDATWPRREAAGAWSTLNRTALLVPFVAALAVVGLPRTAAQRFAIAWLVSALAGSALSLHLFEHELLPALAPLVFTIAAFSPGALRRPIRRACGAVLALALIVDAPRMLGALRGAIAEELAEGRETVAVGRALDAALPPEARIVVYGYASGIYLSAERDAAGRFLNHEDAGKTADDGLADDAYLAEVRNAAALVSTRDAVFFPALATLVRARFAPPYHVAGSRFRVYLARPLRRRRLDRQLRGSGIRVGSIGAALPSVPPRGSGGGSPGERRSSRETIRT